MPSLGTAISEGTARVEQPPHMRVGVIEKPCTHTHKAHVSKIFPGPPQGFQTYDRFGMSPPFSAPHGVTAIFHLSRIDEAQIVFHELADVAIDRRSRLLIHRGTSPARFCDRHGTDCSKPTRDGTSTGRMRAATLGYRTQEKRCLGSEFVSGDAHRIAQDRDSVEPSRPCSDCSIPISLVRRSVHSPRTGSPHNWQLTSRTHAPTPASTDSWSHRNSPAPSNHRALTQRLSPL